MADYTAVRIDEIEGIYRGAFKRARAALGVTSFGMQVIDIPPNVNAYPEHDHSEDGQEEVYVTLQGGGQIDIEGELVRLDRDTLVRVAPGTTRKVYPGDEGIRILVIGAVPGATYEAPAVTELGAPDPTARSG
jgi:mannose-6-phosphate isomerase-like protein (cupin superfamily)